MKARFFTLLFAILPRRGQRWLWNRLADSHGYGGIRGLEEFGNGTFYVLGTKKSDVDYFARLLVEQPGKVEQL